MSTEPNLLAEALRLHQQGRLVEAQRLYRQVLESDPRNADAHNLLGATCFSLGQLDDAALHLGEAVRLNPGHAGAHDNRGLLLVAQHKPTEAVASFQRAIELAPGNPRTYFNLANVLAQAGQRRAAIANYEAALRLAPDWPEVHFAIAQVLIEEQAFQRAVDHLRQVLRTCPSEPQAHFFLGLALAAQQQTGPAEAAYREALRLDPAMSAAAVNLAHLLTKGGRAAEAIELLRGVLRSSPNSVHALVNLGSALMRQGAWEEAGEILGQALRLDPQSAPAHSDLGLVLSEQGRYQAAAAHFRQSLAHRPDEAKTHYNLGVALCSAGDLDAAIGAFRRAVELRPDHIGSRRNLTTSLLLKGEFAAGFAMYNWRELPDLDPPAPVWDGSPLAGRDILLMAELGLGDVLQFIRYAPLLKAQAGRVIVRCPTTLLPILARTPGVDRWVTEDSPEMADCCARMFRLPELCRTTLATIPAPVPYVFADPRLIDVWREKLATIQGLKVGIIWQGNPRTPGDAQRSIPLRHYAPLAGVPNVQLISLQHGLGKEQLPHVAGEFSVLELDSTLEAQGTFMESAAIMMNLELVITSDTSAAHLAGALGIPVWLATQLVPHWRWMLTRDDSPWYPTMRLFRQTKAGDWRGVFERMASELRGLVSNRTSQA